MCFTGAVQESNINQILLMWLVMFISRKDKVKLIILSMRNGGMRKKPVLVGVKCALAFAFVTNIDLASLFSSASFVKKTRDL